MRRLLLLLVLPLTASTPTDTNVLMRRVLAFERGYGPFLHALYGCPDPDSSVDPDHCNPANSEIDYKHYSEARKRAMALFELSDPDTIASR